MLNKIHFNSNTFWLLRIEYICLLIISLIALYQNIEQINWIQFILIFALIDLIGYIPGYLYVKRSNQQVPNRTFYILYNLTHNFGVIFLILFICWQLNWLSWSFLAIPIHLFGDRGLLGNFYKPFTSPFTEPTVAH